MPIPQSLRDHLWLLEYREGGLEYVEIARRDHVPVRAVWEGIARAESAGQSRPEIPVVQAPQTIEPDPHQGMPVLVPWFPIVSLVPASACPHRGTVDSGIRRGSRLCCMICNRSGLDHLTVLQRPSVAKGNKKYDGNKDKELTRKEKRAKKHGEKGKDKKLLTREQKRERFLQSRSERRAKAG